MYYRLTVGVDFILKTFHQDDTEYVLQIWDFGGSSRFSDRATFYKGSSAAIFFYDITRAKSTQYIPEFIDDFLPHTIKKFKAPILLVGNKIDLIDQWAVTQREGQMLAEKFKLFEFLECSVKTGEGMDVFYQTLSTIGKDLVNNYVLDASPSPRFSRVRY